MPIAVVFPGQGSQAPGFGSPWTEHPAIRIVERAESAASVELAPLLLDPEADLAPTRSSQLSVLLGSLVAWEAFTAAANDEHPTMDLVGIAGHSLGQITALIASGTLDLTDGIRLAVARADACAAAQAAEPGAMLALLGADEDQARQACAAAPDAAWPANLNGAGQIVVGGRPDVLDAVAEAAEAAGVRRTRRLAVDGAFHTPLMRQAAEELAPTLGELTFRAPSIPVVTNHDAAVVTEADGWPERLTTHLTAPVRWEETVRRLVAAGADTIIEIGPGRTLTGLIRRIAPEVRIADIATPDDVASTLELIAGVPA